MLVHYKELFAKDFSGEYAIPAFNTQDLETTLGIVQAAISKRAPVIIAVSHGTIEYTGLPAIVDIVKDVANNLKVNVPIALHLDHTKDEPSIQEAVNGGFSSVMIDGSHLPFEENIGITKRVVDFAHSKNVWVQGELGRLRGNEDWISVNDAESAFTDPQEAVKFVEMTGVDTLAIAVGTIHGIVKFREKITPKLDIERIKTIDALISKPLILHGASGVPEDQIKEAIAAGIQVINIDTELRLAFTKGVRGALEDKEMYDPRKILGPAIEEVKAAAEKKLDQFNTSNQIK